MWSKIINFMMSLIQEKGQLPSISLTDPVLGEGERQQVRLGLRKVIFCQDVCSFSLPHCCAKLGEG